MTSVVAPIHGTIVCHLSEVHNEVRFATIVGSYPRHQD